MWCRSDHNTTVRASFIILTGQEGADCRRIVCRAFQGIGGSGIYAVCMVIFFELVRPEKWPLYTAIVSVVFVFSLVLGPIIGGAINDSGTWRWVFLLK